MVHISEQNSKVRFFTKKEIVYLSLELLNISIWDHKNEYAIYM